MSRIVTVSHLRHDPGHGGGKYSLPHFLQPALLESADNLFHLTLRADIHLYPDVFQYSGGFTTYVPRNHHMDILTGYKVPGSRTSGDSLHVLARVFDCRKFHGVRVDNHIIPAPAESRINKTRHRLSG
jgi:hypothetical protein